MQNFDTPAPISLVLDIPAGRVQLIAADRADTTVEVLPADAGKGRDVQLAEQTTAAYADGVLRITVPEPKNRHVGHTGSVEVTVQLPAGSTLELADDYVIATISELTVQDLGDTEGEGEETATAESTEG